MFHGRLARTRAAGVHLRLTRLNRSFGLSESQKSSDDHQRLAGAEMVRLQSEMGPQRLWRLGSVVRAVGSHLVAGHRIVQQVNLSMENVRRRNGGNE